MIWIICQRMWFGYLLHSSILLAVGTKNSIICRSISHSTIIKNWFILYESNFLLHTGLSSLLFASYVAGMMPHEHFEWQILHKVPLPLPLLLPFFSYYFLHSVPLVASVTGNRTNLFHYWHMNSTQQNFISLLSKRLRTPKLLWRCLLPPIYFQFWFRLFYVFLKWQCPWKHFL